MLEKHSTILAKFRITFVGSTFIVNFLLENPFLTPLNSMDRAQSCKQQKTWQGRDRNLVLLANA